MLDIPIMIGSLWDLKRDSSFSKDFIVFSAIMIGSLWDLKLMVR